MKPFRWCFIGAGNLANTVAQTILPSRRHEIVSVYTRRWEKCEEFAEKYHAKPYRTAEEAIADPNVDAVYIVTPHTSHFLYAKTALELGKPVLVEKPFTVEAKNAKALIQLAREKKCYIAEAMWTWFAPAAYQVKEWVDAGELGMITTAEMSFCMKEGKFPQRLTDSKMAGGALLDVGIYPIAYAYRLFGNPTKIECTGRVENGIDLCEDVLLTFGNGLQVKCSSSMIDENGKEDLLLDGDRGQIQCESYYRANEIELVRTSGGREVFDGDGSYLNEFDIVAEEIREGLTQSRYVPFSATSDVCEILDECRRQMGLDYSDILRLNDSDTLYIRRAAKRDMERIDELLYQVDMVHHLGRPDLFKVGKKYTDEQLLAIIENDKTPIFVATDENDKVLGYAFCIFQQHVDNNILTDIKTLYIDDLCVDETLRGQHIGKQLYEAVLAFAKENKFYNVTLNVWSCNESAMRFYESCGLKPQKVGMETIL